MGIQLANIVKGAVGRLTRVKQSNRFASISWVREKLLKHEEDKRLKTIRIGNIRLSYKRPYEVLHTYRELFEEEIYKFTSNTTTPYIIDCGANIGLSVLYFKRLYPNASILAFEPDAENFSILQKNISQNNLTDIECRQHAVWIHNETITFASDGTQGSGITTNPEQKNAIQLKADRLADILKERRIDFLKMDIEGAEVTVIKDCEAYLENVARLFVEYHGKATETEKLAELLNVLKKKYSVYIKLAADNLQHPFVNKATGGSFDVQLNIFCYH